MHGFSDARMNEMYGCQPAICALAVANMARTVKMGWLPGARMGVSLRALFPPTVFAVKVSRCVIPYRF